MHLVDHAREYIEENYKRPLFDRILRATLAQILPYEKRFRFAMRGAKLAKPLAPIMPPKIRNMVDFAPTELPPPSLNACMIASGFCGNRPARETSGLNDGLCAKGIEHRY